MKQLLCVLGVVLAALMRCEVTAGELVYRRAVLADNPVAYWEFDAGTGGSVLLPSGSECSYFKGTMEPPADWSDPVFDDSGWLSGATGIGYGDGDDATELLDMQGNYASVFVRLEFDVADPAVENLFLKIIYDDAFVGYLNGTEVARSNIFGTPPGFNIGANSTNGNVDTDGSDLFNISEHSGLLVAGKNVLAVQVHNRTLDSSDLSMNPSLVQFRDTPALDSSGNGHDGSSMGFVGFGVESFNQNLGTAIDLNGSDAYIDIPALGTFEASSIEAWVVLDRIQPPPENYTSLYSNDSFGGGNHHLNIGWRLEIQQAIAGGGPNNVDTALNTLQLDTWYHIVSTYDSTANGEAIMYVNGAEVARGGHFAAPMARLVAAQIGGWNGTRLLDGRVDEVAIYDRALSRAQIQAHFAAATAPPVVELKVVSFSYDPDSRLLSFTWTSAPNQMFIVEYSDDMINWVELTDSQESEGATTSYRFPAPVGLEQVYARARLLPTN